MARIRSIKPEFWTSEQVMECSRDARLLFIGLWTFCDDGGRMPFSPKRLKAQIFPVDDDVSSESVRRMIVELSSNGLVEIYTIENKEFLQITGWHHQKIDRPNFQYPDKKGDIPKGFRAISRRTIVERSPPKRWRSRVDLKKEIDSDSIGDSTNESTGTRARARRADSVGSAPPVDDWPSDYRQQFEDAYPHKVSMRQALAMLDKSRGKVSWRVLLNGIASYCAHKPEDRNWMNPKTWIEQERWNDKPARTNGKHERRHVADDLVEEARRAERSGGGKTVEVGGAELGGDHAQAISAGKRT